jgi:hypothetical protein
MDDMLIKLFINKFNDLIISKISGVNLLKIVKKNKESGSIEICNGFINLHMLFKLSAACLLKSPTGLSRTDPGKK